MIITKDEDFVLLRAMQAEGPSIVWLRLGNTTKRVLLDWFERALPMILKALERGERLVEVA